MPNIFGFFGEALPCFNTLGHQPLCSHPMLSLWRDKASISKPDFCEEKGISLWIFGRIMKEGLAFQLMQRYKSVGFQALADLEGNCFSILLDQNTLYLCRGTGGSQRLYHAQDAKGRLCFSNRLETLLHWIEKPTISKSSLFEYLRFLDISEPATIYADVFILNSNLILCAENLKHDLIEKKTKSYEIPQGNPVEIFECLLLQSIQKKVYGIDRLGAFLSCGIDSSLICALTAQLRSDCKLFTVGFNEPQLDESDRAKKIAKHLKLEHEAFFFNQDECMNAFHDFTSSTANPFADPAIIPTVLCFQALKDKADCVLDGTGADSLIGIMPCRHVKFILDYSMHIPAWARHKIASLMQALPYLNSYTELFDFKDAAELLIRWKGFNQSDIFELCHESCDFSNTFFYKTFYQNSNESAYQIYSKLFGAMNDDRVHQTAIRLGLQVDFPFMDRATRHYVGSLSEGWKHTQLETKYIYRRVLDKYIPPNLLNSPKHGFDYPFHQLLKYRDFELIQSYLNPDALRFHGFFDEAYTKDLINKFKSGNMEVQFKVWSLVVFQAWYANYYNSI